MDLIVVGNGILGLATALRAAARGDRVTVVGSPSRTGSATLAAAAMLGAFGELEPGSRESEHGRLWFDLVRRAVGAWPVFATELAGNTGELGFGTGTYLLDYEYPGFDAAIAALVELGEPHKVIAAGEVPGYAPVRRTERAVRLDREGWVNPRRVVTALERALAANGVTFVSSEAKRLIETRGAIAGVDLADGSTLSGSHVVLATGASTGALAATAGLALQRMFYGVGVTVELAAEPRRACLRTGSTYVVPYGNRVIVGATSAASAVPVVEAPPGSAELLRRNAGELVDRSLAAAEIVRANVGWRPLTEDTYPLLGPTSIPNLVVATGTRRDGFHLAPVISEYLAAVLHEEPVDSRMTLFAPERAPVTALPATRAAERAELLRL